MHSVSHISNLLLMQVDINIKFKGKPQDNLQMLEIVHG